MSHFSLYQAVFKHFSQATALLSSSSDPIILDVNDAFALAAGRARDELVGRALFDAFPTDPAEPGSDAVASLRGSLERVCRSRQPHVMLGQRYSIPVEEQGGVDRFDVRYWNAVNTPVFGDSGEMVCIIHTTIDVTEQTLSQGALARSEARYRTLFESIDEAFCILEMIRDGEGRPLDYRFETVNPVFARQTGLRDVEGSTARSLIPGLEDQWVETYDRVSRTGAPIRFARESKAMGRWYDAYAFRIDESGSDRVGVLFKDITDQKRAEEDLRRSEQTAHEAARLAESERRQLNAVLEAAPVGIIVSDVDGKILLANSAHRRLWGLRHPMPDCIADVAAWCGQWADDSARRGQALTPEDWTTARVLRGEEAPRDVIEITSFDDPPQHRIVLNSGAPIRGAQGAIVGAVVAEMDVTDRVRAEHALREGDRQKDEFLAMLAHELRNPLAPIAAAAGLLARGRLDEASVRDTSAIISRQVGHLAALVNDLLDVSRVTRGLAVLDKALLDVKRIVADAIEQARPLIESRGHHLSVHMPPTAAFVMGDEKRLVQVMTNLLNNAAKYTPEGGSIVVGLDVHAGHVTLSVTDNGIGMDAELVESAFELFKQAERTSDRSQGGLGIGLALVRSLMELHGGTVKAFSAGPGEGSRFEACLPQIDATSGSPPAEPGPPTLAAPPRALRVMIVDDNADAAAMLAMLIGAAGHETVVEHRSGAALERARRERPHVCLLDIGLPDMDGNQLARRLRALPETADAVLVAITGYGQDQDRRDTVTAGFDHHFVKPVDVTRLAALLSYIAETAPSDRH